MDVDRTSLSDRTTDLRTRPQQAQEQTGPAAENAPVKPDHSGPVATSANDREHEPEPDPNSDARRKEAYETISRFLHLPGGTELDIRVDVEEELVTFEIRDRRTGELLYTVPEDESGPLVDKLRDYAGSLLDRSF